MCCRKPSGHADKEVMAATVLTSLSTSPLVLYPSSAPTGNTINNSTTNWGGADGKMFKTCLTEQQTGPAHQIWLCGVSLYSTAPEGNIMEAAKESVVWPQSDNSEKSCFKFWQNTLLTPLYNCSKSETSDTLISHSLTWKSFHRIWG